MGASDALGDIVMRSPSMRLAVELARLYAQFDRPIVFIGPVGVGKTTLAREAFQPPRLKGRFVCLSAGDLDDHLFRDSLFGHVAGAFTDARISSQGAFAEAANGALLLDDLAFMPTAAQAAILRVIDTQRFRPLGAQRDEAASCRLLFATTIAPSELVADGRLLRDLESRLGEFQVHVPPLCERPEDILPIARACAERFTTKHHVHADVEIAGDAVVLLEAYTWPGNVRELSGVMDYAVVHAGVRGGAVNIRPAHLPERFRPCAPQVVGTKPRVSAALVEATVRATAGNKSEAARRLGVHRNTIGRRLRSVG